MPSCRTQSQRSQRGQHGATAPLVCVEEGQPCPTCSNGCGRTTGIDCVLAGRTATVAVRCYGLRAASSSTLIRPSICLVRDAWLTHASTTESGCGRTCIVLHSVPLPGQGQGVQLGSSSCERLLHWPRMYGDAESLTLILHSQMPRPTYKPLQTGMFVEGKPGCNPERDCLV